MYFQEKGVLQRRSKCDHCDRFMMLQNHDRSIDGVIYRCVQCKRTKSIRKGTFMENSKIPLRVFAAVLYFHHAELLQKHIAELLGVSRQTLVDWSNFIRERCSLMLLREGKLGGRLVRVQVRVEE